MSPQAKMNTKWILTVVGSVIAILITVISATATITTKFNVNDRDHIVIKQTLGGEIKRSTTTDLQREGSIEKISLKLDDVSRKQVQVMTKQDRIIEDIADIADKLE